MSKPNIGRLVGTLRPSTAVQNDLQARSKAITKANDQGWLYLMNDSDKRLKSDLFNDPPEKFVARLDCGDLVYATLIENALLTDRQYLAYLVELHQMYTVVYVYAGRSQHQRRALSQLFANYSDWRVVPTSPGRCCELMIQMKGAWEIWIFHHYFDFAYCPTGEYYAVD